MTATGIAITGMGIISAIGDNVQANHNSLIKGRSGISRLENFKSIHQEKLPVGEIKLTNSQLEEQLKLSPRHNSTRGTMLGAIAAKEAMKMAQLTSEDLESTGFINGTSVGGMDMTERFYPNFDIPEDNTRFIETIDAGATTQNIAEYLGIKGYTSTISTACSSGANAILLGARLIKAGRLKRVIVGGVDCLSKFTLNGFHSLMLCSESHCKPFDANRNGLNLGEGAAYIILEAEDAIDKNKTKVLVRLTGYGNANDAFHQTASSPDGDGAFLAMTKALKSANLNPQSIDFINAHGTATPNNDAAESAAIMRVFQEIKIPDFSSTKAFTGHTLASAGAIEAVFSILMLQQQELYANLNFEAPIAESGLTPVLSFKKENVNHIMSNSFGFGGNCTSLIFSKS